MQPGRRKGEISPSGGPRFFCYTYGCNFYWPGSSGVERSPEKAGVGGSIPSLATIESRTALFNSPHLILSLLAFKIYPIHLASLKFGMIIGAQLIESVDYLSINHCDVVATLNV